MKSINFQNQQKFESKTPFTTLTSEKLNINKQTFPQPHSAYPYPLDSDHNNEFDNQFTQEPKEKQNQTKSVKIQTKIGKKLSESDKQKSSISNKKSNKNQEISKNSTNFGEEKYEKYIKQTFLTSNPHGQRLKIDPFDPKSSAKANLQANPLTLMQEKINQIAKSIRERVKKSPKQVSKLILHDKFGLKNEIKGGRSMHKLQTKDIILSPINKIQNSINLSEERASKLLTFQNLDKRQQKQMIQDLVKNQILAKLWRSINIIDKKKLKLDPIQHKYPISTFRRAIVEQHKNMLKEEQRKIKEKEEKLIQRRNIYNSSRYQRYVKQEKLKKSRSLLKQQPTHQTLVLLRKEKEESENIQNPQKTENRVSIGIFPTQQENQTIDNIENSRSPSSQSLGSGKQEQFEYKDDFL